MVYSGAQCCSWTVHIPLSFFMWSQDQAQNHRSLRLAVPGGESMFSRIESWNICIFPFVIISVLTRSEVTYECKFIKISMLSGSFFLLYAFPRFGLRADNLRR